MSCRDSTSGCCNLPERFLLISTVIRTMLFGMTQKGIDYIQIKEHCQISCILDFEFLFVSFDKFGLNSLLLVSDLFCIFEDGANGVVSMLKWPSLN